MGFLFKKKKEYENVVVFDIGSGSVRAAFVQIPYDKKKLPIIYKTFHNKIAQSNKDFGSSKLKKNMLKAVDLSTNSVYNALVGIPDRIVCVLASPWYTSETKIIKLKKETSFEFTKKIAENLIQKEIKKTKILINKTDNTPKNEIEIIENQIMNISLNGYRVIAPLGMKTQSVEMNIITSFTSKLLLDKIRLNISKRFHETPITFSSFISSFYFPVREKYISPDSYLLIDVGAEITEVGIVLRGILKSTLSFPFGKNTFLKYISTKLKIDLRDSKELFKLYNSGDLLNEKKIKVDPLFKSIESLWSELFRNSIKKLPYILSLPGTMFITADNDVVDYFSKIINNDKYIKSMTISHKSIVIPLKVSDFLKLVKVGKQAEHDIFLVLEVLEIMRKG